MKKWGMCNHWCSEKANYVKEKSLDLIPFIVMIAVLMVEIVPLINFNHFPKSNFMDQDYAKIVRHVIEIGDKR